MRPCCALILSRPPLVLQTKGATDHDTPIPEVASYCAYHPLGRLARRGRRVSGPEHRWADQPERRNSPWCLSRDEVDRLGRHRPIGRRIVAQWDCPVTLHHVGLVPALLGPGETRTNCLCHHRIATEDETHWLRRRRRGASGIVQRRSAQAEDRTRGSCLRRPAAAARSHTTVYL